MDPTLNGLHSAIKYGAQFRRVVNIDEMKGRIEQSWISFRIAVDAGIRICAGVDALGTLFEEIELFVQGGLSPMQALMAATKTNAEVLGAADRLGTIETGKYADLLIIDGNPVERISELRNIDVTMRRRRCLPDRRVDEGDTPGNLVRGSENNGRASGPRGCKARPKPDADPRRTSRRGMRWNVGRGIDGRRRTSSRRSAAPDRLLLRRTWMNRDARRSVAQAARLDRPITRCESEARRLFGIGCLGRTQLLLCASLI